MKKGFQMAVRNALRSLGAIEFVSLETTTYEVETSVGILRVVPHNGVIRCRFSDPVSARKKVLCKRISGRWDHYRLPNETMKEFVADFERSLMYLKGASA